MNDVVGSYMVFSLVPIFTGTATESAKNVYSNADPISGGIPKGGWTPPLGKWGFAVSIVYL